MPEQTEPRVEVRRSRRRRRTVTAYRDRDDTIVVLVPDSLSPAQEREWVTKMVARIERKERRSRRSDEDLIRRARALSDEYLGGLAVPVSVRWSSNQRSRWGSCTPGERTIRLSERLQQMPDWVVDYVLVHELAHLIEPHHDEKFWAWVGHYPYTEKAKGYLLGWSEALRISPPHGDHGDHGA